MVVMLKILWNNAISTGLMVLSSSTRFRNPYPMKYAAMKSTVPMTLNRICSTVTRFALRLTPILEISAVAQVPMFCPMMIGMAIPQVIWPVMARACSIPTDAAEL